MIHKNKKYIKFKKLFWLDIICDNFIITTNGFLYLESLQKNNKDYENSLIGIAISSVALIVSDFALIISSSDFSSKDLFWCSVVFVVIETAVFLWYFKDILHKNYY